MKVGRVVPKRWIVVLFVWVFSPAQASVIDLEMPDVESVLKADQKAGELRYRYAVPVDIALEIGTRFTSPQTAVEVTANGERIWRQRLQATGARSLSLHFNAFDIAPGAQVFIAGERDRHGPYHADDAVGGQFWSPVVRGEWLEIEFRQSAPIDFYLAVDTVFYGFRGFSSEPSGVSAKSGACNVDVACSVADEWRREVRSVARISIANSFLCSGQLLNNTAQDFRPLFLTAAHCLSTPLEAQSVVSYFNFETSRCGLSPDGDLSQSITGSSLLASSLVPSALSPFTGPDFTLLELNEQPPPNFRVYYSGWDNRDIAPDSVVGIHHPSGDEKRISVENDPLRVTSFGQTQVPLGDLLSATHLRVADWDMGTTEGGSSGSGIWNAEHRLVGQLSGGAAACGNDAADWYGRFHRNWFGVQTALTSVATHLDPLGLGVEVLDGIDPAKDSPGGAVVVPGTPSQGGSGGGGGGGGSGFSLIFLLLAARLRRVKRT